MNAAAPLPPVSPLSASAARVAPNQSHAFGGIWRLTFYRYLLPMRWVTVVIALAVLTLLCFSAGPKAARSGHFVDWTINFYITFLVPVTAFMAAGGAMRDEMKAGTVDYVLTRPVRRPAFLVFKYFAHTVCTQLDFLLGFLVVFAFAKFHEIPNLATVAPKLLFGQILVVTAFSALGFLAAVVTAKYPVIGLVYGLVVEAGVGQIPTQLSRLSMTHQIRDMLSALVHGLSSAADAPGLFSTTLIVIVFMAATLALASTIFSLRELTGPSDA